jgi:hypothetical protein
MPSPAQAWVAPRLARPPQLDGKAVAAHPDRVSAPTRRLPAKRAATCHDAKRAWSVMTVTTLTKKLHGLPV